MTKDLFNHKMEGKIVDSVERYVIDRDKMNFHDKIKRLRYLHKINPEGLSLAGEAEFVLGFRELQFCYIDGHYLAAIVLAQAFVEKILYDYYQNLGFIEIANKGLYSILKHAQKNNIVNSFIIKKVDQIRLIRNPITHLKDFNYPHSLTKRSLKSKLPIPKQLEKDATSVIEIATFIASTDLKVII